MRRLEFFKRQINGVLEQNNMYFIYIIKCKDGTMYTGITTDIKRRFLEHKEGRGGNYTNSRGVSKLLYTEKAKNRSFASKREAKIKSLSRGEKLNLIRSSRAPRAHSGD